MKYFLDNCISWRLAKMLAALEVDAEALRERFDQAIDDVELFQALRGSDCIFISTDSRQRNRELEAKGLRESGMTAIYLGPFWSKKSFQDQAIWLTKHWPKIEAFAVSAKAGAVAEMKENGTLRFYQTCARDGPHEHPSPLVRPPRSQHTTGESPEKPYSGKFVARITPDLHRKLSTIAESSGVSLNQLVADCLGRAADDYSPSRG